MEDDAIQSPSNMIPIALALLGIVLGGAGLYFGVTANQRLNSIDESVEASTTSSARIEKLINRFDTQISELTVQVEEQSKTISRLRIYSSQSEQAVKKLAAELKANREQIVKTAEQLNGFAATGFRAVPSTQASGVEVETASGEAVPAAIPGEASIYVIVSGDNFAKIAAKTGVSLQAILDANPDADPRRLAIGQKVKIPAK